MDYEGNNAADAHAKAGAAMFRGGEAAIARAKEHLRLAKLAGRYIAICQEHAYTTQAWEVQRMDLEAVREARKKEPVEKKATEHALREVGGRMACTRCRRYAVTPAQKLALRAGACVPLLPGGGADSEGSQIHPSHALWASGQLFWCNRCGKHAEAQVKGLHAQCEPPTQWGKRCLRSLAAGNHPKKNAFLGMPRKVDLKGGST